MTRKPPTLTDVARCAGVSYATADRVVNRRGSVADKSVARVRQAIRTLGYVRNVAAANLAQGRSYRFVAVMPSGRNPFFDRLRAALSTAGDALVMDRVFLSIEDVAAFDVDALCDGLERVANDPPDGIVLVGIDDDRVADRVARLREAGVAVITLVSDLSPGARDAYVGIDNMVAGRTAGRLIALAHGPGSGRVLPIVGALSARDHADRFAGFRDCLSSACPQATLLPVIEGRDQDDLVYAQVARALGADAGIGAIYNAGAGTDGLVRALSERPADVSRPVVVLHELSASSVGALRSGLIDIVIDQRPDEEVDRAIQLLRRIAERTPLPAHAPILPAIHVRENLPPDDTFNPTGETE